MQNSNADSQKTKMWWTHTEPTRYNYHISNPHPKNSPTLLLISNPKNPKSSPKFKTLTNLNGSPNQIIGSPKPRIVERSRARSDFIAQSLGGGSRIGHRGCRSDGDLSRLWRDGCPNFLHSEDLRLRLLQETGGREESEGGAPGIDRQGKGHQDPVGSSGSFSSLFL